MKQRNYWLFCTMVLMLVVAMPVSGREVSREEAEQVARGFWNSHRDAGVKPIEGSMRCVPTSMDGFFLLTPADGVGFVLVSAENVVKPILGYSFSSLVNEGLNPEVRYWLGCYQREIEVVRSRAITASVEVQGEWDRYIEAATDVEPRPLLAVAPMITTTWSQVPYYNNLCPYDYSESARAVTGCVATAMAQLMKYWECPTQGEGSHGYQEDDFGWLSANFGATTYDWAHMPVALSAASSTTEVNAVATLMYHCGVSTEMNYSVSGSGAHMVDYGYSNLPCTQHALVDYFGYTDSLESAFREDYSNVDWRLLVKGELDAGRPVIYSGFDSVSGHCFLCDGYNSSETMFHFNWGWGGYCDGYFTLQNLAPADGGTGTTVTNTFNEDQQVLVGVKPRWSSMPVPEPEPECVIDEFPYHLDFDSEEELECIIVLDGNEDDIVWSVLSNGGVDGSACAYVSYADVSDDYMFLPAIARGGYYELRWKARSFHALFPESYSIELGDETIFSQTFADTNFEEHSVVFGVEEGDTVWVAFHYTSQDKFALFIDDIEIVESGEPVVECEDVREVVDSVVCGGCYWFGTEYDESGEYEYVSIGVVAGGCDSVYVLSLTVGQSYYDTLEVEAEERYVWQGEEYTASGVYSRYLTSALGCDSVLVLALTIRERVSVEEVDEVVVKVYPNPTQGCLQLEGVELGDRVEVWSVEGKMVYGCEGCKEVDLRGMPSGAYMVQIGNGNSVRKVRVVKE